MESLVRSILEFIVSLLGTSPDLIHHWTTGRPRLRIVMLKNYSEAKYGELKFEVENVGEEPTSLNPVVTATFATVMGESRLIAFDIREHDLTLPAFTPKQFTAYARELPPNHSQMQDGCYIFKQANGSATKVKI